MKIKCKNADKYDVQKVPTCGCFVCLTKWTLSQIVKAMEEKNKTDKMLIKLFKLGDKKITYLEQDMFNHIWEHGVNNCKKNKKDKKINKIKKVKKAKKTN